MTESDIYIIKAKGANMPNKRIAAKLSLTEAELEARWQIILAEMAFRQVSGYDELAQYFTNMAMQYNLLGESLKVIGTAVGNIMTDDELKSLIDGKDVDKTVENLRKNAIILRSWTPPPAEVSEDAPCPPTTQTTPKSPSPSAGPS